MRVVLAPAAEGPAGVVPDVKGGTFGRGAHVHVDRACLEQACRRGFPRAFKREVRADAAALSSAIATAGERRIQGLLSGGLRSGVVVCGADPVVEALRGGGVRLVIVAADASAAASRAEVQRAVAEGRALVYGDRRRLAEAVGRRGDEIRDGVAVVAVTSEALASEVRRAWSCAMGSASQSRENAE